MDSLNSSQSLWDFALALYVQPNVAKACLYLQDQHQANVCVLLGLCWMDSRAMQLTDADLENLLTYVEPWTQEVVKPLRELRRKLKLPLQQYAQDDTQEGLRELIKKAELSAEKKLLNEIESWSSNIQEATEISHTNIEKYVEILDADKEWIELFKIKIIAN